jgi:hypothetical protein
LTADRKAEKAAHMLMLAVLFMNRSRVLHWHFLLEWAMLGGSLKT